jgi:hypothetical protein
MTALRDVVERLGLFCAWGHFFYTPKAGQQVDHRQLTQVGPGDERSRHSNDPGLFAKRGAGENAALAPGKDVYPQELRLRGITTVEAANAFLRQEYIQEFNSRFTVPAAQSGTAFVLIGSQNLYRVFSIQHERMVSNHNTVHLANMVLQIQPTL